MLILSLTVILPFLIVLAFKSEKKQAKLSHQLSEFKKDLVRTDFGSADPENNNKLLTGEGTITCDETLTDDLFEVDQDEPGRHQAHDHAVDAARHLVHPAARFHIRGRHRWRTQSPRSKLDAWCFEVERSDRLETYS